MAIMELRLGMSDTKMIINNRINPPVTKAMTMQLNLDFSILKVGRMKYNFAAPMSERLEVKINGVLNPKSWIRGIPEAAQKCEKIALRMALEVFVRHCVELSASITIEGAVKVLTGIGFDEKAIREEARDGYFSIFFILKSDTDSE